MRPSIYVFSGLAAASPLVLSDRQTSPIDISGAYWNTHLIGAGGYLAYSLQSIIAVFNNPNFEQVEGRTCISSRVPQPITPSTNPVLVTEHCDEGFSYSAPWYNNLTITQKLKVGGETLTIYGYGATNKTLYSHKNWQPGYPSNQTTIAIGRVDVAYYCSQGDCFTPDGRQRA